MLHPLLVKIDLLNTPNIDSAYQKIENLGLLVKKHNNLLIVKYPQSLKNSKEDYIRNSRGIIIDFENKKIVNTSIPGSVSLDYFKEKVTNFNDVVIEKCLDGTLINLYYYKNKWNVSTKFNINADESKFRSNKTYRQLIDEIINISSLPLDPSYSYTLLLRHKEARNITPIKRNRIIHIESTNTITGEKIKIDLGLNTPKILKFKNIINKYNFQSYENILNNLEKKNWKCPGYMVYSDDRKYRLKLENPNYEKVKNLTKNQNNIEYIILDHLFKKDDIYELLKYYPEWSQHSIEINTKVTEYINDIYQTYIDYKINKNITNINQKYKKPLYNLHEIYINNKKNDIYYKISYQDVCTLVRSYDTAYLYSVLFRN